MGWEMVKIGDVCEVVSGQSPKGQYYNDKGEGLPFYQGKKEFGPRFIGPPQKWTTNITKEAFEGDILMSVRAPVGPVNFATQKVCIGRGLAAIRPGDKIDRNFLFYYLLSIRDEIQGSEGAVFASINRKQIEALEIPLVSIEEQKRIVAILDEAFADIDKARALTERNLKNSRELFESYLLQAFSLHGKNWEVTALENVVSDDCALSYGIVQPGESYNHGLPVVRPTDLVSEVVDGSNLKRINPEKAEGYKRTKLKGGELLVCVRGTTGTISIAANSLAGANVTRGIVPVRFNPEIIDHRFGYYQFSSPLIQKQVAQATYGAALMQINIKDLRKLKVSVPPLSEQEDVVKALDAVKPDLSRAVEIYARKLEHLDELKKSLLQKAFTGKLTKAA